MATPIGNLADLSPHAVDELARADAIVCEDSRRAGKLLAHAGVPARELIVVHDHNESARAPMIVDRLGRGQRIAVITDAGMPGVSDPGERLVRAVVAAGHRVEVVPGPSAAITALVLSGLPTGRFVFEGFLPRKGSGRRERLRLLADERRTIVLHEAPHRLARTLADLSEALGPDRVIVIARELTKTFEEVWRGTLEAACSRAQLGEARGEHVLVVAGAAEPRQPTDDQVRSALEAAAARGLSTKDASAAVAAELSVPKRRVYGLAVGSRGA